MFTLTQAPPIDITIAGKAFRMSALTVNDMAEFEQWAARHLNAPAVGFYARPCLALWDTIAGKAQLLWLAMRCHHPTLKASDFMTIPPAALDDLTHAVNRLGEISFPPPPPPEWGDQPNPLTATPGVPPAPSGASGLSPTSAIA